MLLVFFCLWREILLCHNYRLKFHCYHMTSQITLWLWHNFHSKIDNKTLNFYVFRSLKCDKRIWNEFSYGIYETHVFYIPLPKAEGYKTPNLFLKYCMKVIFRLFQILYRLDVKSLIIKWIALWQKQCIVMDGSMEKGSCALLHAIFCNSLTINHSWY